MFIHDNEKQLFQNLETFPGFLDHELNSSKKIVQVDETILNYKSKGYWGRSLSNRTDALCILEVDTRICRTFTVFQ